MAYINPRVLDLGLNILDTEGEAMFLCTQEPTTYIEATSTYDLGEKDYGSPGDAFGAPADGTPNGRKVSSAAITDGAVTADGTATHWAIVDKTNNRLLAANTLAASQVVSTGNVFTLPAVNVRFAAAVSE